MRISLLILVTIVLASCEQEKKWHSLIDEDLSQWETYLSFQHQIGYKGEAPVDTAGNLLTPLGFNVPGQDVFTLIKENDELIVRVSGETYGSIFTKEEFENYHLKLKVKWGTITWTPRKDKLKDTGLLYHSIGNLGDDYWRSWMLSQELQIMEGHMGDYWNIASSTIDIRAILPEDVINPIADEKQPFRTFGSGAELGGYCIRSTNFESPNGEWTEIELICFEDKSLYIVNGHVVMVLQNSRYVKDGKHLPLTKGKLQMQSEAAEFFFKDMKIRDITSMPMKFAEYYKD